MNSELILTQYYLTVTQWEDPTLNYFLIYSSLTMVLIHRKRGEFWVLCAALLDWLGDIMFSSK